MKLKYIFTIVAGSMLMLTACTPDSYDMGSAQYTREALVESEAYTVTVEGNRVHLKSNIPDCTPLWITPQGRSQEKELTLELPFAGDYEITFGVSTRGGKVYGEPYTVNLPVNDFSLLSDPKWFLLTDKSYLEGDALPDADDMEKGVSKRWYPCDANYGIGKCSGPIMYMSPYDPDGDGKGFTKDEENDKNVAFRDVPYGEDNWAVNWDPGFQSWLIPEDSPYMDSYMEFSLDSKKGCIATMYRGEAGVKGSSTGTDLSGKFNLNLTDKNKPLISFSDCYSMHSIGFDGVCENYTSDIQIINLTPYILQIATRRTNSEGHWYLIWNFVSQEVIETDGACIPSDGQSELTQAEPRLPEIADLETKLFTIDINGATYVGSEMTYTIDTEAPYEFLWWNGAPYNADGSQGKWETVINGAYGSNWAPAFTDAIEDFSMTIGHKKESTTTDPKTYLTWETADASGAFFLDEKGQNISFTDMLAEVNGVIPDDFKPMDISFVYASNDDRTVDISGSEFVVLGCEPGSTLTLGLPEGKDENGYVNLYRVVNLVYKQITTGPEGPTVVELDTEWEKTPWVENGCIRVPFHHYGAGGTGLFKDVTKVKVKKGQTLSVTFKITGNDITWSQAPKCALIDNNIKTTWEPDCFDLSDAVEVNLSGETTVSLTNTTGSTVTFTDACLDLSIQFVGYGTSANPDISNSDGAPADWDAVGIEIVSCTIQ